MDKLISADALINIIGTTFTDREHGNPHYFNGLATAVEIIENAEEAVVRCKDCRFYLQSNEKCELVDTRLHFYETDKMWTADCYCAWGERREDDV